MSTRRVNSKSILPASDDGRQGHGYGRIGEPKGAGSTWTMPQTYPYVEGEPLEPAEDEVAEDEDLLRHFVQMVALGNIQGRDPYGARRARVDRGSFAHSSGRGLGESALNSSDGIAPLPGLYKSMAPFGPPIGGLSWNYITLRSGDVGRGGSKAGYASPPPPMLSQDLETVDGWRSVPTDWERQLQQAADIHQSLLDQTKDDDEQSDEEPS